VTDPGPPTPPPASQPPPSAPVSEAAPWTPTAPGPTRKRWIFVLVGDHELIFGFGAAGTTLFFTNTWPPFEAASDFTSDLEDGDISGAYAQMCDLFHERIGRERFDQFAHSLLDGTTDIDVNPFGVDRDGNRAVVKFTVHRLGGRSADYKMLVLHVNGDWRPCFVV
jgi:hypothetical protein